MTALNVLVFGASSNLPGEPQALQTPYFCASPWALALRHRYNPTESFSGSWRPWPGSGEGGGWLQSALSENQNQVWICFRPCLRQSVFSLQSCQQF